jgi:hypothetical protein
MRHIFVTVVCCLLTSTALLLHPATGFTASASHEDAGHGSPKHEAAEKVPFDRPVEEIQEFLGKLTELELHPCSDCHDEEWEVNPERRELDEPHDEIPGKFVNHDSENRWCLDCHSANQRDKLILLNGKLIEFSEYHRLCEQCHKRVYREWKMGVHGKRTGYWNSEKEYWQCTQCHNPHDPPFKPLKPEPAPRKPLKVRIMSKKGK